MSTTDPLPLRPAELKPVGRYYVSFRLDGPPDVAGARAVLEGVGKQGTEEPALQTPLPGEHYWSVTATRDGETFYLSRNLAEVTCTSDVARVRLADDGSVRDLVPVPGSHVAGQRFSDLQLSPDGTRLAMMTHRQVWVDGSYCEPSRRRPDLVVLDLASGARRTWTQDVESRGSGVGANVLAWSFDGECLVFPWPIHQRQDDETVLRKLDVTAAEGPLETASTPVPRDDEFAATGRTCPIPVMSGQGEYPRELAAFLPQGGARILAYAIRPPRRHRGLPRPDEQDSEAVPLDPTKPSPSMVEISLVTGRIRELPR